jgi:prephenate dehydrogenase
MRDVLPLDTRVRDRRTGFAGRVVGCLLERDGMAYLVQALDVVDTEGRPIDAEWVTESDVIVLAIPTFDGGFEAVH